MVWPKYNNVRRRGTSRELDISHHPSVMRYSFSIEQRNHSCSSSSPSPPLPSLDLMSSHLASSHLVSSHLPSSHLISLSSPPFVSSHLPLISSHPISSGFACRISPEEFRAPWRLHFEHLCRTKRLLLVSHWGLHVGFRREISRHHGASILSTHLVQNWICWSPIGVCMSDSTGRDCRAPWRLHFEHSSHAKRLL